MSNLKNKLTAVLFFLLTVTVLFTVTSCGNKTKIVSDASIKYLSEEEYLNNEADSKNNSGLTVGVGEKGYVVVDFILSGLNKISEDAVANVEIDFSTNSIVTFNIEAEEIPTSDYSVSGASFDASFKVYDREKDEKTFRFIVSVTANGACELSVHARISIPDVADEKPIVLSGSTAAWGSVSVKEAAVKESKLSYELSGDKSYYIVTGLDGETGDKIVIPDKYNDLPVKEISANAFSEIKYLKEITLPAELTKIGVGAFKNCTALKSIFIPKTVTEIGDGAFEGCTDVLVQCEIKEKPDGWSESCFSGVAHVTWEFNKYFVFKLSTDGQSYSLQSAKGAFGDVVIPSTYVNLPVTEISENAFSACVELTGVTIPNSVKTIGSAAFDGCSKLKSIVLPSGIKEIGVSVFRNCTSLSSVTVPEGVTSIRTEAFNGCVSLASIELPSSIIDIGDYAFASCDGLTEIVIPDSAETIGRYVFYSCDMLASVTVGKGVTVIWDNVFEECTKLNSLSFNDTSTWYRTKNMTELDEKSGGSQTSVSEASSNAANFRDTYKEYMWYKK